MDTTNTEVATQGQHSTAAQSEIWEIKTLGIAGITSERSIEKIEKALGAKDGVKEVQIDRQNGLVTIIFDSRKTNMAELHEILLRSGYKPPLAVEPRP